MKSKQLEPFKLDNYKFKIIKMNNIVKVNKHKCTLIYYLLADQQNWVHDYKVIFNDLVITNITTRSHQEIQHKNPSNRLMLRMNLLNKLGLEHIYQDKNRHSKHKDYSHFKKEEIAALNINEYLYGYDFRKLTFQNVTYLITGSNPKGEGKSSKGTINVKFDNQYYPFGFMLQCLNISSEINKCYTNISYEPIWTSFKNKELNDIYNFDSWIKEDSVLDLYWRKFVCYSSEWKQIMDDFEKVTNDRKIELMNIEKEINKLRRQQKVNLDALIKQETTNSCESIKTLYLKMFNNKNFDNSYEYAHIKPVWYTKQQIINILNSKEVSKEHNVIKINKLLDEISDPYNLLALDASIHSLYDKQYIYWNPDGMLVILQADKIENLEQIKKYQEISSLWLNEHIISYLKDYQELILSDRLNIK